MDGDEDFVTQNQSGRHQLTSSSTSRPSNSLNQISPEVMSQIVLLLEQARGIKSPAEQKPYDKKPNIKEECRLCKKLYANKTTLFRHYRAIHKEMNPEKYHGCSLNDTVLSLDASLRDTECSICGYVASSQSSLDNHNRTTHSIVVPSGLKGNPNNKENINHISENINIKDKMHKCDECACYFEDRKIFDEHMKVHHGFEVVCKICNKNFLFKDIDAHVKDSHPDVYSKKNKEEKKEKVIIEKVMRDKRGRRVQVFVCTMCDRKMYDKMEAEKHARGHKKGLKVKATYRNDSSKFIKNCVDLTSKYDVIILTCDDCNVSTHSYDVAVEHSQNHITNKLYSEQCVTQTCSICELKFEPLCYKKHMDFHYKDKEIHKESFKYIQYHFQSLLTEKWFEPFDKTNPAIKNMISESIYTHTRGVKMRVMHEGLCRLYKCCQCDNFVEPAAVVNHTINYDTCLKIKSRYACDICKRNFNNRLTRDTHVKDHIIESSFKVIIFNNERDKEFNSMLNDPNMLNSTNTSLNAEKPDCNDSNGHTKVVYKCLCGLCFVRKETAYVHKKICPGKDKKMICPKCDNLFDSEELLLHCFEHHLNGMQIIIENITPDVIVIDSDEELENKDDSVIEIGSSDEDDVPATSNPAPTEIKCVPTNLLLKPLHFETITLNGEPLNDISMKEEKPWLFDPTDFSNICRRPSLRQIDMLAASSSTSINQEVVLESLLTDDEEDISNNEQTEKNPNVNIANYDSTVTQPAQTGNTVELFHEIADILHPNDLDQNECLNSTEKPVHNGNMVDDYEDNIQSEFSENETSNSIHNKQVQNNEDSNKEYKVDVFLPPGNLNNSCDTSNLIQIKIEQNDTIETEYNQNKENDSLLIGNVIDENSKSCIIF